MMFKRFCIFLFITSAAFAQNKCPQGKSGALEISSDFFGDSPVDQVDIEELRSSKGRLFRIQDSESCGQKGCDFILAHEGKDTCLRLAFEGSGKIHSPSGDYSTIKYRPSFSPVDKKKKTRTLVFDEITHRYVRKGQ